MKLSLKWLQPVHDQPILVPIKQHLRWITIEITEWKNIYASQYKAPNKYVHSVAMDKRVVYGRVLGQVGTAFIYIKLKKQHIHRMSIAEKRMLSG